MSDRKAYYKKHYEENKEKKKAYGKKHYEENREKYKAYGKKYREENKAYFKKYYEENREKDNARRKKYREENRDKLLDQTTRQNFKRTFNIPKKEVPKELVEAYVKLTKIRRFSRNQKEVTS
tara:strand:+ start:660 stop:1025 length:366 start_codon:yes stop_codon:yes gene_type:complete